MSVNDDSCAPQLRELQNKVVALEKDNLYLHKRIQIIEDGCCSEENHEKSFRVSFLLEKIVEDISSLKEMSKKEATHNNDNIEKIEMEVLQLKKLMNSYTKYFYIGIGMLMVVEFLGAGEKVRELILH